MGQEASLFPSRPRRGRAPGARKRRGGAGRRTCSTSCMPLMMSGADGSPKKADTELIGESGAPNCGMTATKDAERGHHTSHRACASRQPCAQPRRTNECATRPPHVHVARIGATCASHLPQPLAPCPPGSAQAPQRLHTPAWAQGARRAGRQLRAITVPVCLRVAAMTHPATRCAGCWRRACGAAGSSTIRTDPATCQSARSRPTMWSLTASTLRCAAGATRAQSARIWGCGPAAPRATPQGALQAGARALTAPISDAGAAKAAPSAQAGHTAVAPTGELHRACTGHRRREHSFRRNQAS